MRRTMNLIALATATLLLAGCAAPAQPTDVPASSSSAPASPVSANTYTQIPMSSLAEALSKDQDAILLDVRTPEEYRDGYIPGAINLSSSAINAETASVMIPDKDQTIYVYCRSGNRSRTAAEALVRLGYTRIIEAGGIRDWTGEITPGN